jgi:hypothetical protein
LFFFDFKAVFRESALHGLFLRRGVEAIERGAQGLMTCGDLRFFFLG